MFHGSLCKTAAGRDASDGDQIVKVGQDLALLRSLHVLHALYQLLVHLQSGIIYSPRDYNIAQLAKI